jgi:hypothetical protein
MTASSSQGDAVYEATTRCHLLPPPSAPDGKDVVARRPANAGRRTPRSCRRRSSRLPRLRHSWVSFQTFSPNVSPASILAKKKRSAPILRSLRRSPDRLPDGLSVALRAPLTCRLLRGTSAVRGLLRQTAVFQPAGGLALQDQRPTTHDPGWQPRPCSGRCPSPRTLAGLPVPEHSSVLGSR